MEVSKMDKKRIDEYLDRYCATQEVDRETAKTHFMVQVVSQYYKDQNKVEDEQNSTMDSGK